MVAPVAIGQATPGFYRTKKGRLIRVMRRGDVSSRWPAEPGRRGRDIPYRSYADPAAPDVFDRVEFFGWLPPDYPVTPAEAPLAVAEAIAARAALARANFGLGSAAGDGRAREGAASSRPPARGTGGISRSLVRDPRLPAPGTVLRRRYKGKDYEVTVGEAGVEYTGKRYGSLSAAGAAIVGGTCNGYVFFGLVKRQARGD